MEGEDVFGSKISVHYSNHPSNHSSVVNRTVVHQHSNKDMIGAACKMRHFTPFPPPPNPAKVAPPRLLNLSLRPRCNDEEKEATSGYDELSTEMVYTFLLSFYDIMSLECPMLNKLIVIIRGSVNNQTLTTLFIVP